MILSLFIACIIVSTDVQAQSLLNATARIPALSNFNELLSTFPDVAAGLLTDISTGLQRQTILIPSNDAFDRYRQQYGASVSSLSSSDVGNVLNYHTLQGALSSSDLQQPDGLVSETALRNPTYARRENATDAGDSLPQVVYIASTPTATGRKIKARQVNALSSVDVRSGEGNEIELEQTPGNWSGGVFYVVNGWVFVMTSESFLFITRGYRFLTLPVSQTDTMTSANLTSFVRGLARTNVTEGTVGKPKGNTIAGRMLKSLSQAFEALSNSTGNLTEGPGSLLATVTRHGLTGSYYSTNFTDGDLIQSQNGYPILVTRRNGSIFLNDARLVGSNYIANSGSVHALDRIMGFLNTITNETTPADAPIYSDVANIPTPPPTSTAMTSSEGVIPTSNATGNEILPSATETGQPDPAASEAGPPAETGSTEGTSAASSFKMLLTGSVVVGTALAVGILAL
ncbi:MAG: hypothetical protein Q9209_002459 [Squamulea sp. 1 TL-2023]